MADFTIKRNDWGEIEPLRARLKKLAVDPETGEVEQEEGKDKYVPIDLTNAESVTLLLRSKTLLIKTGPMDFEDRPGGVVSYGFQDAEGGDPADTATADTYRMEFEILWKSGAGKTTVPNEGTLELKIEEDLGP